MSEDVTKEVDQLLKDREKYEAWLARLETEKGSTSQRAYERVRGDYQRRLDEISGQLRAHSDAIKAKLRGVEGKVADLEKERGARAEQLDEARLRHSVGEYGEGKEWADLEGRLTGSVQESERELEQARGEIDRLEQIIASVEGTGAEAKPAAPAKAKAPAKPEPPAPAKAQRAAPETPRPSRGPVSAPARPEAAESAAAREEGAADEGYLSLEELVLEDKSPDEAVVKEKPEEAAKEAAAGGEEAAVGDELAFLESLSLSGGEESQSFSFLERHGSGTPQTIICPHCSAANDPAEWYCTECGEELPAE